MQTHIADSDPLQRPIRAGSRGSRAAAAIGSSAPRDTALLNALTIVVHDLRGPLANLSVLIEVIESYASMQAGERVLRSTERAAKLIDALDDMLTGVLERVRESGDPLAFRPGLVDGADVMARIAELNRPLAESRGIKIEVKAEGPCVLGGDRRLLLEAVDNLVSNAVKYAPSGSTIACAAEVRGRSAVLSVSDQGRGLGEIELRRAFRPFATLSARNGVREPSWGLGLWIVRLIAERHHGRVDVHVGDERQGTRFEIVLPR